MNSAPMPRPKPAIALPHGAANALGSLDPAGALVAQRTQVDGCPGAVGPPRLRDFGESAAGAVPLGDFGVQPAFVAVQGVGAFAPRATTSSAANGPSPLTCCTRWTAWPGSIARSAAPSSSPSRAASATARRYSLLRPGRSRWSRARVCGGGTRRPGRSGRSAQRAAGRPARCAAAAPAPTMPRPRRGMETARPQPGQPRLRVGDHRVPAAHLRPPPPVDVQRQEPGGVLRRPLRPSLGSIGAGPGEADHHVHELEQFGGVRGSC
jgi:hypothetical protein